MDFWDRRLPLYTYIEPLWTGRSVLEIGCGAGAGSDFLIAHGAARVVAIDTDPSHIERARSRHRRPNLEFRSVPQLGDLGKLAETFDVVLVPEGDALVRRAEVIAAWKQVLGEGGRLIVSVNNADRQSPPGAGGPGGSAAPTGVGYYELTDALTPHFPRVQMLGQTPFVGFGIMEFDAPAEGLRVDTRLVEGGTEPTTQYIAVAGAEQGLELGYSLVQAPLASFDPRPAAKRSAPEGEPAAAGALDDRREQAERRLDDVERRGRARVEEAEGRISELRRRLDDATGQSESATRIARAQGEEIEELRGRLRRASEDRTALDGELAKLRRALAEADEAVISLTRRTAEEMTAVAERLAMGIRSPEEASAGRGRLAEYAALRDEAEALRAQLVETEARAGAAERRLEETATSGRDRDQEALDLRARLRRAEDALERERLQVSALQQQVRAAAAQIQKLEARGNALAERDERIARLEEEKQDLTWRTAELEEKLRTAIARAVSLEATRGSTGAPATRPGAPVTTAPSAAAAPRAAAPSAPLPAPARPPAPAAAGVLPATAGAAPAAASAELAEARAARDRALDEFHRAAATHVAEVRRLQASVAEQASLVAELEEGLEAAEARAASAAVDSATVRRNAKELEEADRARRSRLAELEGKLLRLEHEKKATVEAVTGSEELERKLQAAETARETLRAERDLLRAQLEEASRHQPSRNGEDQAGRALPLPRDLLDELSGIEDGLRQEMRTLSSLELRLADELGQLGRRAAGAGLGEGGSGGGSSVAEEAEVIRLHTTLGNFRRRAARLRDEIEGCRLRMESLSISEISGFLQELGDNLAEFEK